MDRVKILIMNHTSRLGGAENVLLTFIENLDNEKYELALVAPEGPLTERAKACGVSCFSFSDINFKSTRRWIRFSDLLGLVSLMKFLWAINKTFRPSLLMSNSVKSHVYVYILSVFTGVPHMVRLHDHLDSFSRLSRVVMKTPFRHASLVSCVSKSVEDSVHGRLGRNINTSVTYNGIRPSNGLDQKCSKKTKTVLTAGWFFPWKGFSEFIEAMNKVAPNATDWKFTIAGDSAADVPESISYKRTLIKLLSESPFNRQFNIYGGYLRLEDVVCCAEHTIFVVPSQRPDPLPTVILEAGKMGIPVVATNIGGAVEILQAGQAGVLTCRDTSAIAESVLKLMQSSEMRHELGRRLESTILNEFSIDTYVMGLSKEIDSVV